MFHLKSIGKEALYCVLVIALIGAPLLFIGCSSKDSGTSSEIVYDNGRTTGNYYLTDYEHGNVVRFTALDFDGNGGVDFDVQIDSEGSPDNGSGTYKVREDGRAFVNDDVAGMVSSDGSIGSLLGIYASGNDNEFMVMIKTSSGMPTTSLDDDYYFVAYESGNTVRFGDASFDPLNNFNYHVLVSSGSLGYGAQLYALASDGKITIGSDITGVVNSTADVITAIGNHSGENNEIIVMIRKSTGMSVANLNGTYYVTNYFYGNMVTMGEASFDGADSVTYSILASSEESPEGGKRQYTVAADGKITIGDAMTGMISSDGNIGAAIELHESDDNGIMLFVKKTP